jgi:hypothetical protein
MEIKKDGYVFKKSINKTKKYDVFKDGKKIVSFGGVKKDGTPYEQYNDKIGLYKKYNHGDKDRKDKYFKRHGDVTSKTSAKYFSHKYLW